MLGMATRGSLANRLRELLAGDPVAIKKGMFGGLAFLVDRNMSVAASGQGGLKVRADPADEGPRRRGLRVGTICPATHLPNVATWGERCRDRASTLSGRRRAAWRLQRLAL
jgi:hypothetical protein